MVFALASLVVAVDVVLGWVQEDPGRWPRRLTHALTEPALRPLRRINSILPFRGVDWSPVVLIAGLTVLKVVMS